MCYETYIKIQLIMNADANLFNMSAYVSLQKCVDGNHIHFCYHELFIE